MMNVETPLGGLLVTVGSPLLVSIYFLEGLLVGKLLHPSLLFILYVVAAGPSLVVTAVVGAFCVVSATAGQLALYKGFSAESDDADDADDDAVTEGGFTRVVPYLNRAATSVRGRIGERRLGVIDRWFDRFGGHGIWLSNATPGFRGLMTIPAGLSGYPVSRFVLLSALGNGLYMVLLIAVANGFLEAVRFVPWDLSPERFLSSIHE